MQSLTSSFTCSVEIHRRLLSPANEATNPTPAFSADFSSAGCKSEEIARQYSHVAVSEVQAKALQCATNSILLRQGFLYVVDTCQVT